MSFAPFALMNKLGCLSLAENCQLQACSVAWHPSSRSFVSVDFRKRVLHLSFQIKRGQKAKAIKGFLWGISSRIAPSSQKENTWSQGMPLEAIYIGLSQMLHLVHSHKTTAALLQSLHISGCHCTSRPTIHKCFLLKEPWKLNSNSYPSAQCSRNQGAKRAELAPSAEKGRKFPTIFCEHLLQNASDKRLDKGGEESFDPFACRCTAAS